MRLRSASLVLLCLLGVATFPRAAQADDALEKEIEQERARERIRLAQEKEAEKERARERARMAENLGREGRFVEQRVLLKEAFARTLASSRDELNSLLKEVQALQSRGEPRAAIGLNEQLVRGLRLTRRGRPEAMEVLRRRERLDWPPLLQEPTYEAARARFQKHLSVAIQQAIQGKTAPAAVDCMDGALLIMKKRLREQLLKGGIPAALYFTVRPFLDDLDGTLKALQDADALEYLTVYGTKPAAEPFVFQGKTVTELVRFMAENKLAFAPPKPEEWETCRALQAALTNYREELKRLPPTHEGLPAENR